MRGKISFPYMPLKVALYSDKVDKLGYIYGDKKTGEGMKMEEYNARLQQNYNAFNTVFNGGYLNKKYGVLEHNSKTIDKTKYEYYDIDCPVYNMRKSDMQPFELVKCRQEGLMFIMIIDIPISIVDAEVESELRFWIKDSMSINIHHEIPDAKRLEMLPTKELKIKMGDVEGVLSKCRLINFENPFRLTILVDKMLNK